MCKSKVRIFALVAAVAILCAPGAYAQFGNIPGMPQWVIDIDGNAKWAKNLIMLGKEIGLIMQIQRDSQYAMQSFRTKSYWITAIPSFVRIRVNNHVGETTGWSQAAAGGTVDPQSTWDNSTVALSSDVATVASDPNGGLHLDSLASAEILSASGANNLATVNQSRAFLQQSTPAMQRLQATVADASPATQSYTQQLSEVAGLGSQNLSVNVQSLNVQTSQLQTMTGIANMLANSVTYDTNFWAKERLIRQTKSTDVVGFGAAFMAHQ